MRHSRSHFSSARSAMRAVLLPLLLLAGLSAMPAQAAPRVVVSIAPIHSLVAGVMDGVAEPQLLIAANASPHAYSLRPSEARALNQAEMVVWVGGELESMLGQPLAALAGKARIIELSKLEKMWLLPLREGGVWEAHDHDEHDGHHHHRHEHHHHDQVVKQASLDPHLWLAPRNARHIVTVLAEELAHLDPTNAARYAANAAQLREGIDRLEQQLRQQLAGLQGRPYIVFHDAYHYFEDSFGLTPAGSITISPEQAPGARRIAEIRRTIQQRGARCVFSEPQFRPAVVKVVLEGSIARAGELDPLGAGLAPGQEQWFGLMQGLADSLVGCLE